MKMLGLKEHEPDKRYFPYEDKHQPSFIVIQC